MKKAALIGILVLAIFLRFWRLGDFPSLNADEAAIGYNAYSLIQTGQDEHGNAWPIHFQSFNDFKPGLYFYIVLPFVKFFGLNEWSVRLPSATFGVLTILAVYLLVKELMERNKNLGKDSGYAILPLLSAFMLAINPWHIHFSRGGWEVNVATFFITLGVWLFIKAIKSQKILLLSAISFALSLYTYHAARVIVPFLGFGLLVIYWKKLKVNLKYLFLSGAVFLVVLTPLVVDFTKGSLLSRAAGVGLFADPGPITRINEQRGEHLDFSSFITIAHHNKAVNYSLAFLENWAEHYWGEFLFLSGDDIERNKVPETGQMYLLDILFLVAGFIAIAKGSSKDNKLNWKPILLWLIVAPFAAALTFQSPHALRAQNMMIPLVIVSSQGLIFLSLWLHRVVRNKKYLDAIFVLFVIFFSWSFARYLHMYWVHMAREYPFSSQYGLKELVAYVEQNEDKYQKIMVTDRYDQPYILFLFYLKYPPDMFQKSHILTDIDEFGFSTVESFGKYKFGKIEFENVSKENDKSLIIGAGSEIPDDANIVKSIYGTNEYLYFEVVENN